MTAQVTGYFSKAKELIEKLKPVVKRRYMLVFQPSLMRK